MAENILSKDEVNALLQAVSSGNVETSPGAREKAAARKAVPFDFSQPASLSHKQLNILKSVHEIFARRLSASLSSQLNLEAAAKLAGVDQQSYRELETGLPALGAMTLVNMSGLNQRVLFSMQPKLGFGIAERMMGGPGATEDLQRPFTEIEREIIDDTMNTTVKELESAWEQIAKTAMKIESRCYGTQWLKYLQPQDMTISINVTVHLRDASSLLILCYPIEILDWIAALFGLLSGSESKKESKDAKPDVPIDIKSSLQAVSVEAKARLGPVQIRLRDVMGIREGDVLLFDRHVNEPFELEVGERTRFKGFLGRNLDRKVFAITQKL